MKNSCLKICDATIHPGERLSLALPLPELFSCAPIYMPLKVNHGKQPGPCLLITAAMHGNELNGTEIINRLLNLAQLKALRGTLITVPILNVYGFLNRSRTLPGGIELDTVFPGTSLGSHASRMAHIFTQEIFSLADVCIDLQTGFLNHTNLPQVYVDFNNEKARQLSQTFNTPIISRINITKGGLAAVAQKQQKPFLLYESGEAMRFDEYAIKTGMKGIINVMKELGMLPNKTTIKNKAITKSHFTEGSIWVRASTSGISHTKYKLGEYIKKGQQLCVIRDPFGATDDVTLDSPLDGIIVAKNNLPLVHEGEALFQLAFFPKMQQASEHLQDWKAQGVQPS